MSGNRTSHPGEDGSMDLGFGPDPIRPSVRPDPQGHVTLTQEQFEQLLGSVQESRAELDYARALGNLPQAPVQQQTVDPLEAMLSDLPSPATDPDGFRKGLADVLRAGREDIVQRAGAAVTQQSEQVNVFDQAWNLMQEQFPDVASQPEIVQMATTREMDDLRRRGLDPMRVLESNMEEAVAAIANRAMGTINRVRGLPEDAEDAAGEVSDRSDILTGGSGYRPKPAARAAVPGSSLVSEIQKIQREMGIY
jgi:hypothetical protein